MELAGKVIAILEARSGVSRNTGNPWKMQDFVIETHEAYPRRMVFNVFGEDKLNQFNIQMGDELNVSFDINAREYQGRWYNDIRAWKVDRIQVDPATGQPVMPAAPAAQPVGEPSAQPESPIAAAPITPQSFESSDPADDLPF